MSLTVAGPTAIADAGASLVAYLEDALSGIVPADSIVLGDADDVASKGPIVAIELVDVFENPHLRNGQWRPGESAPVVTPTALVVDLRYRITVHPARNPARDRTHIDPTQSTYRRHQVVGHVMHALHEGASLDDPHLQGTLADGPAVRVTYDQEDRTPDYQALTVESPALHYLVTPIVVDSSDAGIDRRLPGRIPEMTARDELIPSVRLPKSVQKTVPTTGQTPGRSNRSTDQHTTRDK